MPRRSSTLVLLLFAFALPACNKGSAASAAQASPRPAAAKAAPAGAAAVQPVGPAAAAGTPGAAGTPAAPFDLSKLPAVVARVNGQAILREDLMKRADAMRAQMRRIGAPEPPHTEEFYRAMLDQLIGQRLLLAEAKKRGLGATEAEIGARLAQIRSGFSTPGDFDKQLAAQGMTAKQVATEVGENITIQKLVDADITPAVKVGEDAERAFYQKNLDKMKRPAQVHVRHVLVAVAPKATPEQKEAARKRADALLTRVKKGEDFATLARDNSDDPGSKGAGGLLPWMGRGETVPPFEQAAFALKPGETSGVVESPFGYHILRLEEKHDASTVPFAEAKPRIEEVLSRQQAMDLLQKKVTSLRQAAKVEVLF